MCGLSSIGRVKPPIASGKDWGASPWIDALFHHPFDIFGSVISCQDKRKFDFSISAVIRCCRGALFVLSFVAFIIVVVSVGFRASWLQIERKENEGREYRSEGSCQFHVAELLRMLCKCRCVCCFASNDSFYKFDCQNSFQQYRNFWIPDCFDKNGSASVVLVIVLKPLLLRRPFWSNTCFQSSSQISGEIDASQGSCAFSPFFFESCGRSEF